MIIKLSLIFVIFLNLVFSGKLYFNGHNELRCDDGITKCSLDQTCCRNSRNDFGCCAFANATCCEGGLHCCPSGFHCTEDGCSKDKQVVLPAEQSKDPKQTLENKICPDEKTFCQEGQTCCLLSGGQYGCCPLPDAVCCEDHEHCCPAGSTCDATHAACKRQDGLMLDWSQKLPATQLALQNPTVCPDKKSICPGSSTCCLLPGGTYGCCPTTDAVCCEDHKHCCPRGYQCDVQHSTCTQSSSSPSSSSSSSSSSPSSIPLLKKLPSYRLDADDEVDEPVLCPNHTIFCDPGYTCCPLLDTHLECCCVFYNGVCCKDQLSCCPQGSVCSTPDDGGAVVCLSRDVQVGGGVTGLMGQGGGAVVETVDMLETSASGIVPCDDTVYCQDGQTCCRSGSSFMCCPHEGGSCCADGMTCCKHYCIPIFNTCIPSTYHTTMTVFKDALNDEEEAVANVVAKEAVWCDAGKSLYCPEGFKCDMQARKCTRSGMLKGAEAADVKVLASKPLVAGRKLVKDDTATSVVEDESHLETPNSLKLPQLEASLLPHICSNPPPSQASLQCGREEKCCGGYGGASRCCPYEQGVCCEGGTTCCPEGSECTSSGMCKASSMDMFVEQDKLTAPKPASQAGLVASDLSSVGDEGVMCPDKSQCPVDTTCCILFDDQYACCQFKEAVCCGDKIHCCPKGFTCDVAQSMCQQSESLSRFSSSPSSSSFSSSSSSLKVSWEMFTRKRASKAIPSKPSTHLCTQPPSITPTHRCPLEFSCCYDDVDVTNTPVCCNQDSVCCGGFCCPEGFKCGGVRGECVKA